MKALRACGETHHRRGRKYGGSRGGGEGRTARLVLSWPGVGSQGGAGGQLTTDSCSSCCPSSPSRGRQSRSTRAVAGAETKQIVCFDAKIRKDHNDKNVLNRQFVNLVAMIHAGSTTVCGVSSLVDDVKQEELQKALRYVTSLLQFMYLLKLYCFL